MSVLERWSKKSIYKLWFLRDQENCPQWRGVHVTEATVRRGSTVSNKLGVVAGSAHADFSTGLQSRPKRPRSFWSSPRMWTFEHSVSADLKRAGSGDEIDWPDEIIAETIYPGEHPPVIHNSLTQQSMRFLFL